MASQWTTERVLEAAREWVWIPHDALRDDSQPADLQDQLRDRGAMLVEETDILAINIGPASRPTSRVTTCSSAGSATKPPSATAR